MVKAFANVNTSQLAVCPCVWENEEDCAETVEDRPMVYTEVSTMNMGPHFDKHHFRPRKSHKSIITPQSKVFDLG